MCPDYWIQAGDAAARLSIVLAAGEAGGTIDGQSWRTPAAWKAIIYDNQVAEWHVFADSKPVRHSRQAAGRNTLDSQA